MKESAALNSSLYFRLLYDGADRTSDLSFCSGNLYHNLCPVINLENFIKFQLFRIAQVDSLNELCDSAI